MPNPKYLWCGGSLRSRVPPFLSHIRAFEPSSHYNTYVEPNMEYVDRNRPKSIVNIFFCSCFFLGGGYKYWHSNFLLILSSFFPLISLSAHFHTSGPLLGWLHPSEKYRVSSATKGPSARSALKYNHQSPLKRPRYYGPRAQKLRIPEKVSIKEGGWKIDQTTSTF